MKRVAKFEKVSLKQFKIDIKHTFDEDMPDDVIEKLYSEISLPTRATSGSAGYDFKSPIWFSLKAGESIKIPTGIRVWMDEGWWLGCLPRSGLGFKYRLQLDNTLGVIDGDYVYSSNEGHIFAKITNDSRDNKTVTVDKGAGFMQAVLMPYGITYDDDAQGVRDGGLGSTDN